MYSLLCYCHYIIIFHTSYVVVVIVKEASHEFKVGTNDLS